jgi:polysaccharide biosynthesis transport protein
LQMDGPDPEILASKLNRIAEVYIQETLRLKSRDESKYRDILEAKLKSAEAKVKEVEDELRKFYQQYPLSLDAEKQKFLDQLKDSDQALAELPRQREQLSDLLDQLEKEQDLPDKKKYKRFIIHQITNFPPLINEPQMAIQRQTLEQQEAEYDKLMQTFSPKNPRLVELDRNIQDSYAKIVNFASEYRNTLAEKVAQHRENLKSIQAQLKTLPNDEYRLMELERIKKVNENLYTSLYTELNSLEVSDAAKSDEITILDRAIPPKSPINASTNQKVLIAAAVGLLVGLVICIIIEFFDKSIRTPEDVGKYLGLNLLGVIPVVDFQDIPVYHDFEKVKQIDHQLVTHDYSPTPIGESYRALRTHLMFSKNTGPIQTLLITSIQPEEGKSFTASNLAIILAQQRTNTLLVDADLRRGVLHNTFSIKKNPGLSDFLSNSATFSSITQPTHVPNLSLIACGAMIPNPSELLGSLQMRRFLEETRRKFDIIVFDTPPLDAATDAVVLGSQVDAITIVVRSGHTNYKIANERLEIFKTIPANVIGVILNGSENALLENYYSYYHY